MTNLSAMAARTPQNAAEKGTPFALHGLLSVSGTDLVDMHGSKYQLYGISTHGLSWFPQYVSRDTFLSLRDEWNTNCVRLALYTHEYGGYCTNGDKARLKQLVRDGVNYATELGMYVIIDWHVLREESPLKYADEAAEFFAEMSALYANNGNVIYEICNEPNASADWTDITAYAERVIPVIRKNAPDSVVIVGTPTWSQDIEIAADAPLSYKNVMYALHFYAGTHKEWLRDRLERSIEKGLPVFISEFGICDSSGSGRLDYEQAEKWKSVICRHNISFICWNLANRAESSCVIKHGCDKLCGWTKDELSEQGKWITEWFKSEKNR